MSSNLGFTIAIANAYDLLRSVSCTGEVYSDCFGLNLRRRVDSPGEDTYTLDSSHAGFRGIKVVFYCEDDHCIKTVYSPNVDPDDTGWLKQLNRDTDILVRTLDSPLHIRRGGDHCDDHQVILDQLASASMLPGPKCDLVTLVNALAGAHPIAMAPSTPWDSVPYPATSDQDFSIVADPEGEMLILRMAGGTWLVRMDQDGVDWILDRLAAS